MQRGGQTMVGKGGQRDKSGNDKAGRSLIGRCHQIEQYNPDMAVPYLQLSQRSHLIGLLYNCRECHLQYV